MIEKDFVIVGSGIAGLSAAFFASQKGSVALITKGYDLKDSKSFLNNDGVIFSKNLDLLKKDILETHSNTSYKCQKNEEKIDFFIENVNGVFHFLKDVLGINFNSEGENIFGYSGKDLFFAGENTGEEICKKFISKIESNSNIEFFFNTEVTELISEKVQYRDARSDQIGGDKVFGVVGKDLNSGIEQNFFSENILLATGSGDGIYNFDYVSDGIKIAKSVGAQIGKMNSISWNPFCLDLDDIDRYFLPLNILEKGAFLINGQGDKFLEKYKADNVNLKFFMLDLSNAFFSESKKYGTVFLDMRHKTRDYWRGVYPKLCSFLEHQGIDISINALPLKNIQQFLIGGIEVTDFAKSSVYGLYISGELANFGVLGEKWLPGVMIPKSIMLSKSFVDNAVL